MVLDPMGGIVLTNDGNAILREVWEKYFYFEIFLYFIFLDSSPTSSW
jgi:Mn-dependent DtxR family transcriptional regulator